MEPLHIQSTRNTPEIMLDPNGAFSIRGTSVAENTHVIFGQMHEWVDNYLHDPAPLTTLDIFLTYFNTTTSKELYNLMYKLRDLKESQKSDVIIKWMYEHDDGDMQEAGEDYSRIVKLPFEFVAVKP